MIYAWKGNSQGYGFADSFSVGHSKSYKENIYKFYNGWHTVCNHCLLNPITQLPVSKTTIVGPKCLAKW